MSKNVKKNKYEPPYLLGILGVIPLVGLFVGIGLILLGIMQYKSRKLIVIGIACIMFTIMIYSILFYIGFKSNSGDEIWTEHVQKQLNSLVEHIEYYKFENGKYPNSLQQLKNQNNLVIIADPIQSAEHKENVYYNYKNLGNKYLLFSSGNDGIPNTEDDIFPKVR